MSLPIIIALILVVLLIIAALAFALYKAQFRVKEITAKAGPLEMKMERAPATNSAQETSPAGPALAAQFSQEATDGGVIEKATIEASADAPASATQKAEGPGSRLVEVDIKIKK